MSPCMNISLIFKLASEFYIGFVRKGLKKVFLILNVSGGGGKRHITCKLCIVTNLQTPDVKT